jgi:hypothetical protein
MIGHHSPRYMHVGPFAARLDDRANWPPARRHNPGPRLHPHRALIALALAATSI